LPCVQGISNGLVTVWAMVAAPAACATGEMKELVRVLTQPCGHACLSASLQCMRALVHMCASLRRQSEDARRHQTGRPTSVCASCSYQRPAKHW